MSKSYRHISERDTGWARLYKEDGTEVNIADMWDALWSRDEAAMRMLSHPANHVRNGDLYRFFRNVTDLGNGTTDQIHVKTGAKKVYITGVIVTPEAEQFTETISELTAVTDGSTEIEVHNANRNFDDSNTTVVAFTDSSGFTKGTTFEDIYMPGESGIGQSRTNDRYQSSIEWVLEPNSNYLIENTNNGSGNSDLHYELHWYELEVS